MEKLKHIKQSLLDCAYCQVDNLHNVDAKELGEVIDMIKDIEETIYYYTVTEAMVSKGYSSEYESNNHHKEGKSPTCRKSYMDARETHHDKGVHMRELEKYVKELTDDLMEMIEGASLEEKQLLQKKLATLATKIA